MKADRKDIRSMSRAEDKMKAAVIGCGTISEIYLKNMTTRFVNLEIVACADIVMENAKRRAAQFGLEAWTVEEVLESGEIEMVIVLTPAFAHYEVIRRALLAGKHVYTEKTMTIRSQDAKELLEIAEEKNLYLGAAPDTFLGAALQNARRAIDQGALGEITSFQINANRDLDYIGSRFKIVCAPGGGICHDFGVYYLTALVGLLGPVKRVSAIVRNKARIRKNIWKSSPEYGEDYEYPNESQVMAVIELENGICGNFVVNGDSIGTDLADFKIMGTEGVLKLSDPNEFGGEIELIPNGCRCEDAPKNRILDYGFAYTQNSRGVGPAEMARAIRTGEKNRAGKEMAYHVLDVINQMMESSQSGRFETVESTCSRPAPFDDGGELLIMD